MPQGPITAVSALAECLKLARGGRHPEAESSCRQALTLFSESAELRIFLSRILLARQDYQGTYDVLVPAMEGSANRGDLYYNFGLALKGLGRLEEALIWVQRAADLDPGTPVLRAKLGQIQLMVFRPEEAAKNLRLAHRGNPADVSTIINLAHANMDLGNFAAAEELLQGASGSEKERALVAQQRGSLAETLGDFEAALNYYSIAIEANPGLLRARVGIAYARKTVSRDDPNLRALEGMIRDGAIEELDRGLVHYAIGKSLEDLKEYEGAMLHYDVANAVFLDFQAQIGKRFEENEYQERCNKLADYAAAVPDSVIREARSESARPVFIVGMIRSGTTLVEQMLGRHSRIAPGGELRFWTSIGAQILQDKAEEPRFLKRAVDDYEHLLNRISELSPRVVDKMPTNYHLLRLLLRLFPNATFIHCKRDAVDTAISIYTTKFKGSPDFGHSRSHIVSGYLTYLELMKKVAGEYVGDRLIEVRYEDLVANPREQLERMLDAIGVEWEPACLEPERSTQPVATPSAWQVRQPIYSTSVRRADRFPAWKSDFQLLAGL
jgi:tetratricopeptide (TPR) repeat protein